MSPNCWRCGKNLILNPDTNTCIYCSYPQDRDHVLRVRIAQAIHGLKESNPKTNGNNPEYAYRKKHSRRECGKRY